MARAVHDGHAAAAEERLDLVLPHDCASAQLHRRPEVGVRGLARRTPLV
jgi:hypothetical protein